MSYDQVNFNQLLQHYGSPLYVYSEEVMRRQYESLESCLKGLPHLICYAVKANSNLSILGFFQQFGSGFDIVSEGELRRVVASGGEASKVVFAGVGKTAGEIEFALASGVKFLNVESVSELKTIAEVSARLNTVAPVSLRINPDVSVDTHPYLATGLATSKFGIPLSEIDQIWNIISKDRHLNLVGIDCHIGSQLNEIAPLQAAYSSVIAVAEKLKAKGAKISSLDFGGGLAIGFSGHYKPLDLDSYGTMLKKILSGLDYEIILEPGKFLVAEAGILLTKILYLKTNQENQFAVVDAGMNDLIRPSLYEAYHKIDLVNEQGALEVLDENSPANTVVSVVGPVCETGCYLARDRRLPALKEGQVLAIRDSGAYGYSMASNYNSRLLPAEVMISAEGKSRLIRRRQNYEDLWRHELVS